MSRKKGSRKTENALWDALKNIKESIVYLYLFLMLVVHVYYAPEHFYYLATNKLRFFERVTAVFLSVALFLIIFSIIQNRKKLKEFFVFETEEMVVLAFAAWNLISFLFSPYRENTLLGYQGWRMGLMTQLALVAVFLIVKRWKGKQMPVLAVAVVAFFLQCILVIIQRTGEDPLGFYEGMDYFEWNRRNLLGTIGNVNWLCGYMICILPIVIWLYMSEGKLLWRILYGVALYAGLGALLLQGSSSGIVVLTGLCIFILLFFVNDLEKLRRLIMIPFMICSFWMIFSLFRIDLLEAIDVHTPRDVYSPLWTIPTLLLLGVVIFLALFVKKKGNKVIPAKALKIVKIAFLAVFLAGAVFFLAIQIAAALGADIGILEKLRIKDSWGSNRIMLWKLTLQHYFQNGSFTKFLFGVGPDGYGYWFAEEGIYIPKGGLVQSNVYTNAHNDILTTLVNLGLIGAGLYVSLFVLFFRKFWKDKENTFRIPGMLLLLAYFINILFSFQQICATPAFVLLLAVLSSFHRKENSCKGK